MLFERTTKTKIFNSGKFKMKLYLISQNKMCGYDVYDSAVVVAKSAHAAKRMHPSEFVTHSENDVWMGTSPNGETYENDTTSWVQYKNIDEVTVKFLGDTNKSKGVILASFNAG